MRLSSYLLILYLLLVFKSLFSQESKTEYILLKGWDYEKYQTISPKEARDILEDGRVEEYRKLIKTVHKRQAVKNQENFQAISLEEVPQNIFQIQVLLEDGRSKLFKKTEMGYDYFDFHLLGEYRNWEYGNLFLQIEERVGNSCFRFTEFGECPGEYPEYALSFSYEMRCLNKSGKIIMKRIMEQGPEEEGNESLDFAQLSIETYYNP